MRRPSVDPAFTFAVALVLSLALWYPTLRETMKGDIDITAAGIRYFLALAISWSGVYGICALVAMYASQPRRPAPPRPGLSAGTPQRREADEPAAAPTDDKTNAA